MIRYHDNIRTAKSLSFVFALAVAILFIIQAVISCSEREAPQFGRGVAAEPPRDAPACPLAFAAFLASMEEDGVVPAIEPPPAHRACGDLDAVITILDACRRGAVSDRDAAAQIRSRAARCDQAADQEVITL